MFRAVRDTVVSLVREDVHPSVRQCSIARARAGPRTIPPQGGLAERAAAGADRISVECSSAVRYGSSQYHGSGPSLMTSQFLHDVLEAIGYLVDGRPAHGVRMSDDVHVGDQTCGFRADALWKGDSTFIVYFKPGPKVPSGERIAGWHREIWNRGFAPLLWVISPEKVELYNSFGRPRQLGDASEHRMSSFEWIKIGLTELDALAGRLATFLSGQRELRVHCRREVAIIKPNTRRHWICISALEDAEAVIVENFTGAVA